jgi:glycosyltransferase involved in cell wall biosynthesis
MRTVTPTIPRAAPPPRIPHLRRSGDGYAAEAYLAPLVSVVVPVYNGGKAFHACAEALLAALGPMDELIVVADGASDEAWRVLEGTRARIHVTEQTRGPAAARNTGAHLASGDVLFFVDADVVIPADAVERVRQAFAEEPALDALIGSYDADPGDAAFLSQYRNLLHHHTHQTASERAHTFWGACGAVRREAFWAVGGFDEGYAYPCVEDIELGYRLSASGRRIRLVKDLQVKHLKAWTARSITHTDVLRRAVPWTELLLHKGSIENDLNVDVRSRLSVAAVWALPLAVLLAVWAPGTAFATAFGLVALVVILNGTFYAFLRKERGAAFALRALPWHALYFAYSGLGFAIGAARYARSSRKGPTVPRLITDAPTPCTIPPLSSSVPAQPD